MARKLILRNFQSPGDIVMLTAAVRDLHRSYPGQFLTDVRTSSPALWENNPWLTPLDERSPDVESIDCQYPLIHSSNTAPYHFLHGFIEFLNTRLGLNIRPTEFKGDVHLSPVEKSWVSQVEEIVEQDLPFWLIVSGGKFDFTAKWWDPARYQQVVDRLLGRILFVQVGEDGHHHPPLNGVINLVGKTNLRQLVRLVYHAQGVLTPVSLLMHLAAAVEVKNGRSKSRPCVVVAGGREPSQWEAYPHHQFIHTNGSLPCCDNGGCWKSRVLPLGDGDEKDRPENLCVDVAGNLPRCLDMITPEDVIRRIEMYFEGGALTYLDRGRWNAARRAAVPPPVTICVLTYGEYPDLAERTIESIRNHCERPGYRLIVGANAVGVKTLAYLRRLESERAIDTLIVSTENIDKSPMMRRMFEGIDTELIWWFDDDSWITDQHALQSRLEIARGAHPDTVLWGHQFFFGHERDFSYGADVEGFVRGAPWYRGKEPPSWKSGGDGRWFFITGGCWLIRTSTVQALDWPDARLIKRNDDVFLCEAIRQQGLKWEDIGPSGVAINTEPRRGRGEDAETMHHQTRAFETVSNSIRTIDDWRASVTGTSGTGKGCVFVPTFRDTNLLEQNFSDRPELTRGIDFYVFDDNYDPLESRRVRGLCERNAWRYGTSGRSMHGDLDEERDQSAFTRFILDTMIALSADYDYVVKMDTDAYIIETGWHEEFAGLLAGHAAIAGTPEMRRTDDVMGFWNLAGRHFAKTFRLPEHVMHIQGGIYGLNRKALTKLSSAGFMEGEHIFYSDDCYISYACRILGIDFLECKTIGSWFHPYRPRLEGLLNLKAIHPLSRSDWERFQTDSANRMKTLHSRSVASAQR